MYDRWPFADFAARWAPRLLSILRIVIAFLYLTHGATKLLGFPSSAAAPAHTVPLLSFMGLSGILEFGGGVLILLGLFTRPLAFLLCGEMAVAYFKVHAPQGFWPLLNHGELAVAYCFVWLYLSAAGPGPWSLDAFWARRRHDRAA